MIHKPLLFLYLLLIPLGKTIEGQATVIDGDTIEIKGQRIRLHGIDAPESSQTCTLDGKVWRCSQQAALQLSDMINKRNVRCEQKDKDYYGRLVCECFVGKTNINAWLVENGWAVAYRKYNTDFVTEEANARAADVGIWKSKFDNPEDYRKRKKTKSVTVGQSNPVSDCEIKGNISRDGKKIYHLPGGKYYSQTKISTDKGEQWFCTEEEAKKAGWRLSRE